MSFNCIPSALSNLFYRYGKFVATHPIPFLLIPPAVALILSSGMLFIDPNIDVEYLYVPVNAPSLHDREAIRRDFGEDDRIYFTPLRRLEAKGFVQVIIKNKRSNNVYTDQVLQESILLDSFIRNTVVRHETENLTYSDVCASWKGSCEVDTFLHLMNHTSVSDVNLTFPVHRTGSSILFISGPLAKVQLNSEGYVTSATALLLSFDVKFQNEADVARSSAWLNGLRDVLFEFQSPVIRIEFHTSLTLAQVLEDTVATVMPMFVITFVLMTFFALITTLMKDWVRGKPLVALAGETAALFGVGSSFGLLTYLGMPFANAVGIMPFLVIGIGLDDMYILVSAWRYTDHRLPVEERIGLMLQNAAVSITITSVTDALAFGVGCLTPFRSVQIFCAYTGLAVLFVFIYMTTFTTAIMTLSGRREKSQRHCITWRHIGTRPEAVLAGRSKWYRWFCTGGNGTLEHAQKGNEQVRESRVDRDPGNANDVNGDNVNNTEASNFRTTTEKGELNARFETSETNNSRLTEHPGTKNTEFKAPYNESNLPLGHDAALTYQTSRGYKIPLLNHLLEMHFAPFLMKTPVKITCVFIYALYLAVTGYGISVLQEGLNPSNLAPDGSYFARFYNQLLEEYGKYYGPYIMVVFNESLDYTQEHVRQEIERTLVSFKENEYYLNEAEQSVSWLEDFKVYLEMTLRDISALTLEQFVFILRNEFLAVPGFSQYEMDIVFNDDNSTIKMSRMFLRTRGLVNAVEERKMMQISRELASQSTYAVTVFSPLFTYFDQYAVVLKTTLQNLAVAVGSMLFVSLLLIPSLVTVLCVTLTTVFVCAGVMGFMALWGVSLDSVSMINLIMCIGFSVDFAAHVSYHFATSKADTPLDVCKETLGQLGTPIVQAALSTIISIIILASSNSYVFRTFFKIVFLVMVFGFFHALFMLPVLLSTVLCRGRKCCKQKSVTDLARKISATEKACAEVTHTQHGCADEKAESHSTGT